MGWIFLNVVESFYERYSKPFFFYERYSKPFFFYERYSKPFVCTT